MNTLIESKKRKRKRTHKTSKTGSKVQKLQHAAPPNHAEILPIETVRANGGHADVVEEQIELDNSSLNGTSQQNIHSNDYNDNDNRDNGNDDMNVAPSSVCLPENIMKFYNMRHRLWSKFDEGIQMDETAYFSVTPEKIAVHLAQRICQKGRVIIIDGFAGVAGNSIQFALHPNCVHVFAIELNEERCRMGRHNATVYGAQDKITFIPGDFLQVMQSSEMTVGIQKIKKEMLADDAQVVVFLAPPYGGTHSTLSDEYDMNDMEPVDASTLVRMSMQHLSNHICFLLPKNITHWQIGEIIADSGTGMAEYEENCVSGKCKTVSLYLGDLLVHPDRCNDQIELQELIGCD